MARRRTSTLDDLLEIAAHLPWWQGLMLAIVSGVSCHLLAVRAPGIAQDGQTLRTVIIQPLLQNFGYYGQFLFPAIFSLGVVLGLARRSRRRRLLDDVAQAAEFGKTLANLSWREFEILVGEHFRHEGFTVAETGGQGPDGGIDLAMSREGENYLVQCKHWRARKVGVPIIREFYGVLIAQGAVGGYVVSSGEFTREAREFADGRNIQLIDGELLKCWIAQRPAEPKHEIASAEPPVLEPIIESASPSCPVCKSTMRRRVAKKGSYAGKMFWGCSRYPKCRGVVAVEGSAGGS